MVYKVVEYFFFLCPDGVTRRFHLTESAFCDFVIPRMQGGFGLVTVESLIAEDGSERVDQ